MNQTFEVRTEANKEVDTIFARASKRISELEKKFSNLSTYLKAEGKKLDSSCVKKEKPVRTKVKEDTEEYGKNYEESDDR